VARPGSVEDVIATAGAVESSGATAEAVEREGAAAEASVETEGGSTAGKVPEDSVCPRAGDDSTAAAITLIRRLFTGRESLPKSERLGVFPLAK
jgi:hypothetical protein